MPGMLKLSAYTGPAHVLGNRRAARYHERWHRLVATLRNALLRSAPRTPDQSTDDDELFALQCAEGIVRAEFHEVMEAWASRA